jgi:2'-5' RNA ligase
MPRLFVAVDLPERQRRELAWLGARARAALALPDARWTSPNQMHVTLRFIGSVDGERAAALGSALARVSVSRFALSLSGVGVFPPIGARHPPKVLWAGVDPIQGIRACKAAVDDVLGPDLEERERGFTPHVTLARLGGSGDRPARGLVEFLSEHRGLSSPRWQVDSFALYERATLSTGAVHRVIRTYPLG